MSSLSMLSWDLSVADRKAGGYTTRNTAKWKKKTKKRSSKIRRSLEKALLIKEAEEAGFDNYEDMESLSYLQRQIQVYFEFGAIPGCGCGCGGESLRWMLQIESIMKAKGTSFTEARQDLENQERAAEINKMWEVYLSS